MVVVVAWVAAKSFIFFFNVEGSNYDTSIINTQYKEKNKKMEQ